MTDAQKRIGIIALAILAIAAAMYSAFSTMSGEKEKVVGTLPMPAGGGRDSEKAPTGQSAGDSVSGMPADAMNPK